MNYHEKDSSVNGSALALYGTLTCSMELYINKKAKTRLNYFKMHVLNNV